MGIIHIDPNAGVPKQILDRETTSKSRLVYRNKKRVATKTIPKHRAIKSVHVDRGILRSLLILVVTMTQLYLMFAYSRVPYIAHLRELYIETAMSTMSHQWLATRLLPPSVVDGVMTQLNEHRYANLVSASKKELIIPESAQTVDDNAEMPPEEVVPPTPYEVFCELFHELDISTLPEEWDYKNLIQEKNIVDLGVRTVAGDPVWAIDQPNGILIVEVSGDGYKGKLAISKDSSRTILGVTQRNGTGMTVTEICDSYGAVLGINGSAFSDPNGHGNGSLPVGREVSQGKVRKSLSGESYFQLAGFDSDNCFRVGTDLDLNELRDALEFYPVLVFDGEKHVDGSYGMGIQPRSAIGQAVDGATLFLIIDGRQPGHSLGTTVSVCADILLRYDCFNAMHLDGGSSASMTYDGEIITRTSSPSKGGRYLPSAWIVLPLDDAEEIRE